MDKRRNPPLRLKDNKIMYPSRVIVYGDWAVNHVIRESCVVEGGNYESYGWTVTYRPTRHAVPRTFILEDAKRTAKMLDTMFSGLKFENPEALVEAMRDHGMVEHIERRTW